MRSERVLLILLVVHAAWLGWSATLQSPTLTEPGNLAAGLAVWELGRFDVYRVNPPLVKAVAALPVVVSGGDRDWTSGIAESPGARSEFQLGRAFIHAYGERSAQMFAWARWACIPFSLLGAWLCFLWGRALYSSRAGLFAAGLWCFDPNILAHGTLMTTDVPAAALGLAASFLFWRWFSLPTWGRAASAGLLLGLANLAKMNWLILFGLWPAMWLLYAATHRRSRDSSAGTSMRGRRLANQLLQLAALLVIGVYSINLGYLFDGTGTRLGDYQFVSRSLSGGKFAVDGAGNRFRDGWLSAVPVPLPRQFLLGLDHQKLDLEAFPMQSYLRGEWKYGGWWHYYLYAAAVKVPCGTWCLVALAVAMMIYAHRTLRAAEVPNEERHPDASDTETWGKATLVLPGLCLFLLTSSQTGFNHHFRYVVPIFGPLFVVLGGFLDDVFRRRENSRALRATVCALLTWIVASTVWHGCDGLSYFNEVVGGPRGGRFHLLHSNLDWGQDVLRLKRWQDRHPEAETLKIAYYGLFDPADLGVRCKPLDAADLSADGKWKPGWYAISVNYQMGCEWPPQPIDLKGFAEQHASFPCGNSLVLVHVEK